MFLRAWAAEMTLCYGDVISDGAYCLSMCVFNEVANILSILGQGGHAYLKEWLWWAGLLSSKYQKYIQVSIKSNHLHYIIKVNNYDMMAAMVTKKERDGDSTIYVVMLSGDLMSAALTIFI